MKKFLILILLTAFAVNDSLGSPLLFKVTKEINSKDLTELGVFDATKYRQIRIGIKIISVKSDAIQNTPTYVQLVQKREELRVKLEKLQSTLRDKHPDIVATKNEIDKLNDEIEKLVQSDQSWAVGIFGVEGRDEILLSNITSSDNNSLKYSMIIDSPPSKISVKVSGKGIFTVYVWGQ